MKNCIASGNSVRESKECTWINQEQLAGKKRLTRKKNVEKLTTDGFYKPGAKTACNVFT